MKKTAVSEIENILKANHGNVAAVARHFGVNRATIWNRINESTTLMAVLKDSREAMIDNVESRLYKNALAGDTASMIFFLKTQGRNRGYSERVEVTGADGGALRLAWAEHASSDDNTP